MESLAPPLLLIEFVNASVENGDSVRAGIKTYLQNTRDEEFCGQVGIWLFSIEQGVDRETLIKSIQSPYRRALLALLEMGVKGQPVHDRLLELKSDIVIACEAEIQTFVSLLPLKMLLPIMICMFPSFLILLLGPMLKAFLDLL